MRVLCAQRGVFLEKARRRYRVDVPAQVWIESGPNLVYGMATSWIQMLVGFVLTWALLVPVFGVNEFFGQTLPVGFAGGHGTAAALAQAFTDAGYAGTYVCCPLLLLTAIPTTNSSFSFPLSLPYLLSINQVRGD